MWVDDELTIIRKAFEKSTGELPLQIKELAPAIGYEVLHGIVDSLWAIGKPISGVRGAHPRGIRAS